MGGNLTIETEFYPTRKVMKREKLLRNKNGWRSLHTSFRNNNEFEGYNVVFVNGLDDPDNSDQAKSNRLRSELQGLLIKTLENDTITFKDYKILLRLERGLELQQSTINKLVIIKQGGLSGIVQRIKNLFGL